MHRTDLADLSDDALVSCLSTLCAEGHALTARVIVHLIEVEERRLDLRAACTSMFDFCTRRLGMSEGASVPAHHRGPAREALSGLARENRARRAPSVDARPAAAASDGVERRCARRRRGGRDPALGRGAPRAPRAEARRALGHRGARDPVERRDADAARRRRHRCRPRAERAEVADRAALRGAIQGAAHRRSGAEGEAREGAHRKGAGPEGARGAKGRFGLGDQAAARDPRGGAACGIRARRRAVHVHRRSWRALSAARASRAGSCPGEGARRLRTRRRTFASVAEHTTVSQRRRFSARRTSRSASTCINESRRRWSCRHGYRHRQRHAPLHRRRRKSSSLRCVGCETWASARRTRVEPWITSPSFESRTARRWTCKTSSAARSWRSREPRLRSPRRSRPTFLRRVPRSNGYACEYRAPDGRCEERVPAARERWQATVVERQMSEPIRELSWEAAEAETTDHARSLSAADRVRLVAKLTRAAWEGVWP